jgi:hypothetical protein
VVSEAPDTQLDLKAWTAEQIAAEAERSFLAVWERRGGLAEVAVADFPYLRPNDYPKGVRSSLRDAVAYLFVDRLLSNSSFWSAAESNDAWQLDLANLLADAPDLPPSPSGPAGAATAHPLVLAVSVPPIRALASGLRRFAVEPEARFARQRLLLTHRTETRCVCAPTERAATVRQDPWWAAGVAELAGEIDNGATDPARRIRARDLAVSGEKAYPGSHGAQLCRGLVAKIDAPDFALQMMAVDGASRRSLEITHRNLTELHLRVYTVDLERRSRRRVRPLPTDDREIERWIAGRDPAAAWSVSLPPTPDFLHHRTFATPPLAKPGLYLVVASAERSFGKSGNRRVALPFTLSPLVLVQENQKFPWEVRLVEGGDGRPAAGVEVTLYRNTWREAPQPVATRRTDATGRASFVYPGDSGYANFLLIARREATSRWRSTARAAARFGRQQARCSPTAPAARSKAILEGLSHKSEPPERARAAPATDPSGSPTRARRWRRRRSTNRFGWRSSRPAVPSNGRFRLSVARRSAG